MTYSYILILFIFNKKESCVFYVFDNMPLLIAGNSLFLARAVATLNGTRNIRFPEVLYNEGNDYDPNTGVYTCRIPGTYWFSASLGKGSGFNEYISCRIFVNDNLTIGLFFILNNDKHNSYFTVSGSGGFHLDKGDRLWVGNCDYPENIFPGSNTYFSGVLIRPDA